MPSSPARHEPRHEYHIDIGRLRRARRHEHHQIRDSARVDLFQLRHEQRVMRYGTIEPENRKAVFVLCVSERNGRDVDQSRKVYQMPLRQLPTRGNYITRPEP